jgi:hypothetical protein
MRSLHPVKERGIIRIIIMEELMEDQEPITTTIAETENYLAWKAEEPDGETTYHLELNNVTLHFFTEEWQEFLKLTEIIVDEEL